MERRSLLIGLATVMVTPVTVLATHATASTERFRWTSDGRVFVRGSSGWTESINLGKDINILGIDDHGARASMRLERAGRRFVLNTLDGQQWRVT